MKEMRLFEVGFKERPSSMSYYEKFNVCATTGEEAIEKGRQKILEDHEKWWKEEGREMAIFDAYASDKKAIEDLSDARILANRKYQEVADNEGTKYIKMIGGLLLAKLLDCGTAVV